jgi:Asp-tRNA(Asn)/Glu-tRNA(Gln) amidotransferase A subunit family amidase
MLPDTNELNYVSATDAINLFKSGQLSPVELLEAIVQRSSEIEETVNPFADQYFSAARVRAKKAEARYLKGNPRRLEGIPLLVKDSSAIKGIRATVGSLMNAQRIDQHTDPVIERLMRSGANFFARSTCPEFCWLFACHSRMWGVTRNPWRLDITPGGSSGGSAAAVAAGATTIATGSDSTGSIRQPAAQCGVVGYKSPYGRNPLDQHSSFDPYVNVGPITRTIADAALMQNVMSGRHPLDHNSLRQKINIPDNLGSIKGMKIACSMDLGHYLVVDDVRRETQAVMDCLRDAGAEIVEIPINWASEAIRLAHCHEEFIFSGLLQNAIKNHGDKMSDYVPELFETASAVTADDYRRSLEVAGTVWREHLGPLFKNYDALITPGVSCPEVPAENLQKDLIRVNGEDITDTDTAMTALFNMFNRCPVLSVPAGMTDQGLPVGIQIVGRPYDDITTFKIGRAIEDRRPWAGRRPACSY